MLQSTALVNPSTLTKQRVLIVGWGLPKIFSALFVALIATQYGWASGTESNPTFRHDLVKDIVEDVFELSTGPGAYDRIRIHHIYRDEPEKVQRHRESVFLLHGDVWGFQQAFVPSADPERSLPVFLAKRDVDVWGIDLAWTLVPSSVTDTSFMAGWGMQHDVDDLARGMQFVREMRESRGDGRSSLPLLAWSRGGQIGYALLNQEAKRAPQSRHVTALIVADMYMKTDVPAIQDLNCQLASDYQNLLAQGVFAADAAGFFDVIGRLAESDPDGESPLFGPPYTNRLASITVGSALFQFGPSLTPWYHFVGGVFPGNDSATIPTDLRFTNIHHWNRFLTRLSRYEPVRLLKEAAEIACGKATTHFDDGLKNVKVPVFYVGAAGGIGVDGLYTLGLLGSKDVSSHIVRLQSVGAEKLDFGHVDMWYANDADVLLWGRIQRWISMHTNQDR